MFLLILLSVLVGIILTLAVQAYFIRRYYITLPVREKPVNDQFERFILPREIKELFDDADLRNKKDSCVCLNLLLQFLFAELKDTDSIRSWMIQKLNVEFEEMLQTTTGKLIDQIMVRDFTLGPTFPVIKHTSVKNIVPQADNHGIEEVEILADIEYRGGFQIAVDVDILFGKSAYLSIKVSQLRGAIRLQLSRIPFTHWSFSFIEEPLLEFDVDSQFEGRPMPQITSLIINQIRRSIRKKHTLPNYKIRFNPLFTKPSIPPSVQDLYMFGRKISVGQLTVTVLECSRLMKVPPDCKIYCTLALDKLRWVELVSNRRKLWITRDVDIFRGAAQSLGLVFKEEFLLDKYEEVVMIETVTPYSPASDADIRKNDVLIAVNGVRVTSAKQAVKLMKSAGDKFSVRIERAAIPRQQLHDIIVDEDRVVLGDTECVNTSAADTEDTAGNTDEEYINITVRSHTDETQSSSPKRTPSRERKSFSFLSAGGGLFQRRRSREAPSFEGSPSASPRGSPEPSRRLLASLDDENSELMRDRRVHSDGSIEVPGRKASNGSDSGSPNKRDPKIPTNSSSAKLSDPPSNNSLDVLGTIELKKTRLVSVAQTPFWDEKFLFDVEDHHKYLNACVWYRTPEKLDKQSRIIKPQKDLLLGHISVPLMDIATECLTTLQGDTQKSYYLSPPEGRAGASRSKNSISSHPGFDEKISHGDITLAFLHKPTPVQAKDTIHNKRSSSPKKTLSPDTDDLTMTTTTDDNTTNFLSNGDTQGKRAIVEGRHDFIGTQFHSATYCHFCAKKIWLKTAFQCRICAMICHKKCTEKCQKQTLCTKDGPLPKFPFEPAVEQEDIKPEDKPVSPPAARGHIAQKSAALFSRITRRESPKFGRTKSAGTSNKEDLKKRCETPSPSARHKRLSSTDDILVLETKDDQAIPNKHSTLNIPDTVPRTRSSTSLEGLIKQDALKTKDFLNKESGENSLMTDSSDEEEEAMMLQIMKDYRKTSHDNDERVVTAAKQMGKELYSHMSPEERREKLDNMITKFQYEIDAESDHRAELARFERETSNQKQKSQIKEKIIKSDEKIQSLAVLMLHYCAGLQHCMDQLEENKQDEEEFTDTQDLTSDELIHDDNITDIQDEDDLIEKQC
ncbi:PDZ domain-containing protein 8-like isoform X2 [Tubulanus polymorphus]|uniref:PDZ domain-containing protein 8-like isoform X2 n=1 Tax=Tubulanus polymorphus TaxID=672921 RepID=UPI003DA672E5